LADDYGRLPKSAMIGGTSMLDDSVLIFTAGMQWAQTPGYIL